MGDRNDDKSVNLDYSPPPPAPPPPPVPLSRRILARILVLGAVIVAAVGISTGNVSAMVNLLTFAFALVVGAVFVRYGNVRLG